MNAQLEALTRLLVAKNASISAAESCTGGLFASSLTSLAGSSAWFQSSVVTYSNGAKERMLNVKAVTLNTHGAVSHGVAKEMAEGARITSDATFAVAITGVAGPSGGSANKPVGTVYFGLSSATRLLSYRAFFAGSRGEIRQHATSYAVSLALEFIRDEPV